MKTYGRIGVVVPAGGSGVRFGANTPKQYIEIGGLPVIARCIKTALTLDNVVTIVVAAQIEQHVVLSEMLARCGVRDARIHIVAGGHERQSSVYNALGHSSIDDTDVVAIHDAVRPFASPALWTKVITEAFTTGAAIPVLPVTDTLKVVSDAVVTCTADRSSMYRAQTPQAFQTAIIRNAYERALEEEYAGTDCASLCERVGVVVRCVSGEDRNIKITTAFDAVVAEAIFHGNC